MAPVALSNAGAQSNPRQDAPPVGGVTGESIANEFLGSVEVTRTIELDATSLADAEDARQRFGFDPADAAALAETETGQKTLATIGMPLNDAEAADFAERMTLEAKADDLLGRLDEDISSRYAGAWIDHRGGGDQLWRLVDGDDADRRRISELAVFPGRIQVEEADFTLAELESTADQVRVLRDEGDLSFEVNRLSVRPDMNRVVLWADVDEGAARSALDEAGLSVDHFEIVGDTEALSDSGDHVRQGTEVDGCSVGPWALAGIFPVLITAGHCDNNNQDDAESSSDYRMTVECYPAFTGDPGNPCSPSDNDSQVMTADDDPMQIWTDNTYVIRNSNATTDWEITNVAADGGVGDRFGDFTCNSGRMTNGSAGWCGTITDVDLDACGEVDFVEADYTRNRGDSGATVFVWYWPSFDAALQGVHSGQCGGDARYSFQENVSDALGLSGWITR